METDIESLVLKIKVESAYEDGHQSEREQSVTVPPFATLDEMWDHLEEFNGDGHGADNPKLGYCHSITVIDCPAQPGLVGESNEWCGR